MPGNQVKNWEMYHAMRREGMMKESAAKITNWKMGKGKKGKSKGRKWLKKAKKRK